MAMHALANASAFGFAPARANAGHTYGTPRAFKRPGLNHTPARRGPISRARESNDFSEPTVSTSSSCASESVSGDATPKKSYQGPPRVVVLGGGFGGLYTALKMDTLDGWKDGLVPKVTLIDKASTFVFKPMLYELVNETMKDWEVCPEFTDLLEPTNVRFRNARVVDVRPDNPVMLGTKKHADGSGKGGGVVVLDDGGEVEYDYLVIGLGSVVGDGGRVPGAMEHAVPLNSLDDARTLAGALRDMEMKRIQVNGTGTSGTNKYVPKVAIVGGGYAGCELAGVVAERLGSKTKNAEVHLFAGSRFGIMPGAPNGQRESVEKRLAGLGVSTIAGARATAVRADEMNAVNDIDSAKVPTVEPSTKCVLAWKSSAGEEHLSSYDLVCWTVGAQIECPASWPFLRDERTNKITTDKALRAAGYENVFALGDVASVSGEDTFDTTKTRPGDAGYETGAASHYASPPPMPPLPSTAQVAFQQADYAAWNVWSTVGNRPVLPFKYQHIGDMMTTGIADAAVALPVGDATVDGVAGAALRRAAYLYRMPTDAHRLKLATEWLKVGAEQVYEKGASKTLEDWGIEVPEVFKQLEKALPPPPRLPGM